jgi:hypothetical protein
MNRLASHLRTAFSHRYVAQFAIIVLPLICILVDIALEGIFAGPPLFALYALGLIAYATILVGRVPTGFIWIAIGVLGVGAVVAGAIGLVGAIVTAFSFLFSISALFRADKSPFLIFFGFGLVVTIIFVSPLLTSYSLTKVSISTFQSRTSRGARLLGLAGVLAGGALAVVVSLSVQRAVNEWVAQRVSVFETNDTARWEQALREVRANWMCGHRRTCLMPICYKLFQRFNTRSGECGSFACPFGFAIDAPNVPGPLATPFQTVYGHSVFEVCAIGD